jgi:succinyl-diaminopimelate desuccinylase
MRLVFAIVIVCSISFSAAADNVKIYRDLFDRDFLHQVRALVQIPTYRGGAMDERRVQIGLGRMHEGFFGPWALAFNSKLENLKLKPFEWRSADRKYRVFGFRIGSGPKKVSLITHLDTVPPGRGWFQENPLDIEEIERAYGGDITDFITGRGVIDNKGPAVVTFAVLRAIAKAFDATPEKLKGLTLEVLFDTSEETDMSMPHYFKANRAAKPWMGVVHDGFWCVRAEKGIERPLFSVLQGDAIPDKPWIEKLNSSPGPVNQIPDSARALIQALNPRDVRNLAKHIGLLYHAYQFDDPDYRRAYLIVRNPRPGELVLVTRVAGAQHGSAPEENRATGANPLVSLVNFLGRLVETGRLSMNGAARMAQFIKWTWGTRVYGEKHPSLLEAEDETFGIGNGTTYAVTRFKTGGAVTLELDIRYALGHHGVNWDGKSEGTLPGKSRFSKILNTITKRFNTAIPGPQINLITTKTAFAPDLKVPGRNDRFQRIDRAYKQVMGKPCPQLGIGGGTDAKGHPKLLAAGALFHPRLGPPINFHGIDEGAPIKDLKKSGEILFQLLVDVIEKP